MTKTIFITGTSSGLGKRTAIHFAKLGWKVAATMRSPEKEKELTEYGNIKIYKLDVTDLGQVKQAVSDAVRDLGRIDVVVNNAGMGSYGALELADEATIDWQFAVNVRGPINVIRAFLPHFRENGGGKFINISSYMGVTTAVPLGSLYNMSKFALEGLTEGLYYELKPLGIDLHLIEQGGSSGNNFIDNVRWNVDENIKAYEGLTNRLRSLFEQRVNHPSLDDPQTIVDAVSDLATGRSDSFRTLVGDEAKKLMAMRSSMPIEEFLERINASYQ